MNILYISQFLGLCENVHLLSRLLHYMVGFMTVESGQRVTASQADYDVMSEACSVAPFTYHT